MADAPEYFVIIPPSPPAGHQTCTNCGATKPLEEFYLRPLPNDPNHRHRQCRTCQKAKAHERYVADPEKKRAQMQAYSAQAGETQREQHRASNRANYAQAQRRAGRPYQPRLHARKDPVLAPEEIHKLVRDALAELDRAALFVNGFMQGSRAAGKESDLNMLLEALVGAQAVLQQILPSPRPAQPATGDPAGTAAKPQEGPGDKDAAPLGRE